MKTPLLLTALLLCPSLAPAQDHGILLRAMTDEMGRTVRRLEMENLGKPYFVSYTARDIRRLDIQGSLGSLKSPAEHRSRALKMDLRVGDAAFDNAHFVGNSTWRVGPESRTLVLEDDYDALRFDIWEFTDRVYKGALQTLAEKTAYKESRLIRDEMPDLSTEAVASSLSPGADEPVDRALWEERVRRLSAVFRAYPAIQKSEVDLYATRMLTFFVDSEGRRVVKPDHDFELYMEASTQASDGMRLSDRRRVIRQSLDGMPDMAALEAEARSLAEGLAALAAAPLFDENYIGPVLVEGQAAGEFFNQLLARNVSFSRSPWVAEESIKEEFFSSGFAGLFGLRVASPLLSVEDDPSLESFEGTPLIGRYAVDDEGIPARKVRLIEKGRLKDLLMSRAPIKERARSNGHGRAAWSEYPEARAGILLVSAEKTASRAAMKKALLEKAKEYGLKYGLVVRRIAEESDRERSELLAAPTFLYRVYADGGREELVRNARFSGVTLRALRDIALASDRREAYNYYQLGSSRYNQGQVQASLVHPSVLIEEMELKKSEKKPEKLPILPHPGF